CGGRMHGDLVNARRLTSYRRYRCQGDRAGMARPTCQRTVDGVTLDASVLAQVGAVLDMAMTTDPAFRAALHRAWQKLRQTEGRTNVVERTKALQTRIDMLRLRVTRATERYCDNLIGKAEYDMLCARAQADIQQAESE